MSAFKLSIIIPCLNEAANIRATLTPLQALRRRGHEIILNDGGSNDATLTLASSLVDLTTSGKPCRARQMNAGARLATGNVLCFLHADTLPPESIDETIKLALAGSARHWGRFNVRLNNSRWPFRVIEKMMNFRSCISGIATGDQGIFVYRDVFENISGYKDIPLMEDIELSKQLRQLSKPICIKHQTLKTSTRRWEQHGMFRCIFLMWNLRLRYFLGTPASKLAKHYSNNK